MNRTFKLAFALAAALTFAPAVASADPLRISTSVKVHFDDLDLSGAAGATTLMSRLEQASTRICGVRPSPRQIRAMDAFRTCRSQVLAVAVARIDAPTLNALVSREGIKLASR